MKVDTIFVTQFLLLAVCGQELSSRPALSVVKETRHNTQPYEDEANTLSSFAAAEDDHFFVRGLKSTKLDKAKKSSKKGKNTKSHKKDKQHTNKQCNSELFGGVWSYVGGICRNVLGVVIGCDSDGGGGGGETCEYTERVIDYFNGDDAEKACEVGGSFHHTNHVTYDECSGDCVLEYFDLIHDPCELYEPTGLGLMVTINVKKSKDIMQILFSSNGGDSFYNQDDPREAYRLQVDDDEEFSQRHRHRALVNDMDKNQTIESSNACVKSINYFEEASSREPLAVTRYRRPEEDEWVDILQSLPDVIDSIFGGFDSADDALNLIGNIVIVGGTLFPVLGIIGGGLKILQSLFTGWTEGPDPFEEMNNALNKMNDKIDDLKSNMTKGFQDITQAVQTSNYLICWTSFTDQVDENLGPIRTAFRKIQRKRNLLNTDNVDTSPWTTYGIAIQSFDTECLAFIPEEVVKAVLDMLTSPKEWCWRLGLDPYFIAHPDEFNVSVVVYLAELLVELQILQGYCMGTTYKNDDDGLFIEFVEKIHNFLLGKQYCKAAYGSSLTDPHCDNQHYCDISSRECVKRKPSHPTLKREEVNCMITKDGVSQGRDNMCKSGICNFRPIQTKKDRKVCWRSWYTVGLGIKCKIVTEDSLLVEEYLCEDSRKLYLP